MQYKPILENNYKEFWTLLNKLDDETDFMMFEKNERISKSSPSNLKNKIKNSIDKSDFLLGAFDNNQIIGYISAEKGTYKRIQHKAYITIGILEEYTNKGIGTEFFILLDIWAKQQNIKRLELTVETENLNAIKLYKKSGFSIEGTAKNSMHVHNSFRDEYYMAKIY